MDVTLYGFQNHPTSFVVTKIGAPLEECVYLLDFARDIKKRRNHWFSTIGLLVPVVHVGEDVGGYVISVDRGDGYFDNILALWKQHRGSPCHLSA